MATIKISGLDIGNEILNAKIHIDIILNILLRKQIITEEEYEKIKEEIINNYYSQYKVKN